MSSHYAFGCRNNTEDLVFIDPSPSHSSPPTLASSPRAHTPARRLRGSSRDTPAEINNNNEAIVFSRVRHLTVECIRFTSIVKSSYERQPSYSWSIPITFIERCVNVGSTQQHTNCECGQLSNATIEFTATILRSVPQPCPAGQRKPAQGYAKPNTNF